MATKKEKRARGLARREAFMAQLEADNLAALRAEQDRRQRERDDAINEAAKRQSDILKGRSKKFAKIAASAKKNGRVVEDFEKEAGIDLTRNKEITIGEFLEAANRMMPLFSDAHKVHPEMQSQQAYLRQERDAGRLQRVQI